MSLTSPSPQWRRPKYQPESIFEIIIGDMGRPLTVVLATLEQAESQNVYDRVWQERSQEVWHIARASSTKVKPTAAYPVSAQVHNIPVYYQGKKRTTALLDFVTACKDTAMAGHAVLIHCNNTFHRGILLALGLMIFVGYDKDEATRILAAERIIYPGHWLPWCAWTYEEQRDHHAQQFLESQRWLMTLPRLRDAQADGANAANAANAQDAQDDGVTDANAASSTNVLVAHANTADVLVADTADVLVADVVSAANTANVLVADANAANATIAAVAANAAPANDANATDAAVAADAANVVVERVMTRVGGRWRWVCWTCNAYQGTLRKCSECPRWECKSCAFWCTGCPYKYNICSECNALDMYLRRNGRIWKCRRCLR